MPIIKYNDANSACQDILLLMFLLFTKDLPNMDQLGLWTSAWLYSTQATLHHPSVLAHSRTPIYKIPDWMYAVNT